MSKVSKGLILELIKEEQFGSKAEIMDAIRDVCGSIAGSDGGGT